MNIKLLASVTCFVLFLMVFACANKKEEAQESAVADQKEWKEMDDFHLVMAETFHPYKDSANLEPVKAQAGELAASAEKWASAALPEKVNTDAMRDKLEQLKKESAALVQTVSTGTDQAIGDQLTKVHDVFHAINADWYGVEEHGHEHH